MTLRVISFASLVASALLSSAAERTEFAGHHPALAAGLSASSVVAVIALAVTALKWIRSGFAIDQVLLVICAAMFPYLVADLLSKSGTPIGTEGIAIFGFALYGGLSQLTALVLLIYLAVRGLRR